MSFKTFIQRSMALALVAVTVFAPLYAVAYSISGVVVDDEQLPLVQGSIRLLKAKDSVLVNGVITGEDGAFVIDNVPKGRYIVEASYVGFRNEYRQVRVGQRNVRLDTIALQLETMMLRDAVVRGVRTQIKVMEDTIEFAADAYKTAPNAAVEDLLKRLPGVEVDADGKITANGKQVSKILVDGKEFFGDDPKMASKNLPVNMVDRLQVIDRKSDLARLTGVDDGEDETVINLSVKPGMKNGWFGSVEGGYGTDKRYMGTANINRFWNDNQVTIIAGGNNTNNLNFTDMGGMHFRRFGSNNGITTSQALGVNFNVGNKEIFRIGGNVMYTHSDRDTQMERARKNLFADYTSLVNSDQTSRDKGHNFNVELRMVWKPDSFNTLEVRPSFNYNISRSLSDSHSETRMEDALSTLVNRSINNQTSRGNNHDMRINIIYNHNFRNKPGRSFSINASVNNSNTREKSYNYSFNRFFLVNDSVDVRDQYADDHTWANSVNTRLSWTEPLGDAKKGNFLTLAYRFQYRWNNADKMTYNHPVTFPDGYDGEPLIDPSLLWDADLSNRFRNDYMNQDIRAGFKHVSNSSNIDVGLSLVPQRSKSVNLIDDAKSIPTRHVLNLAPYMRYRLKMGKQRSLMINYQGRSSQPSMTQLQPVADKSNPLNIVVGNPDLAPTFTHNVMMRFQDFNGESQRSIMTMVNAGVVQNGIVSFSTFDPETGSQTTTYRNVNGQWNLRAMNMFSMPFRNKQWSVSNFLMAFYNNTVGFNNGHRNRSGSLMMNISPGLSWRPDNTELELRPRYGLQYVSNTLQATPNRTVHTYGGTFNGTYYTPWGLVLSTDLSYTATSGYSAGYDRNEWMWNATISYQFLRDRSATISLKAYDLLQQRSSVYRNVTANYIDDTSYNSLTRYFMVTFAYKFNTFGKDSMPRDRNMYYGPMGPPPGGPMGRPRR